MMNKAEKYTVEKSTPSKNGAGKNKNSGIELKNALEKLTGVKAAMSFFVPVMRNGHKCETAFLYGSETRLEKNRPFAAVTVDYKTGALLEYRNAFISDFADTEKYPMDLLIDYSVPFDRTVSEHCEMVKKLEDLYAKVRAIAFNDVLSGEEKALTAGYYDTLVKMTPKALMPFYEALSPEFFQWLADM